MNNKSFSQTIKEKREEKGWTQTDLAIRAGISQGSISRIENGDQTNLTEETKRKLLNTLDLHSLAIEAPTTFNKPIPVISWVHAGLFAEAVDSWPVGVSGIADPVYSYEKVSDHAFALIVEGDSMLPRFMPGDRAIVDPALKCDNGCACVVWVNGEVSLKLFYDRENEVILRPMNDKYPETIIKKDSKVDFRVIGKVVDIRPKL